MPLTNRQWENLTLKEKDVLKSLDILSLVKPKKRVKAKAKATPVPGLEPYVLKRITTCGTCKTVSTKYYKMISLGRSSLSSVKIKQADVCLSDRVKEEKDFSLNCPKCYATLNQLSKDELIKRIIGGRI